MERAQIAFFMRLPLVTKIVLSMAIAANSVWAQSQSGEDLALALRSNVVRIVAHVVVGEPARLGFGFVVGEASGQLYIATANHVVRGDGLGEVDKKPTIIFFQDQQGKEISGELLGTQLPRGQGDLAVLRVQSPAGYIWRRDVLARAPVGRKDDVWFVGKLGEWYVPTRPGAVNEIRPSGVIRIDALAISVGTSGAPLISQNGIVGMIVIDAGIFSEATPLEVIRRAISNANYPWHLTEVSSPPPPVPVVLPPRVPTLELSNEAREWRDAILRISELDLRTERGSFASGIWFWAKTKLPGASSCFVNMELPKGEYTCDYPVNEYARSESFGLVRGKLTSAFPDWQQVRDDPKNYPHDVRFVNPSPSPFDSFTLHGDLPNRRIQLTIYGH